MTIYHGNDVSHALPELTYVLKVLGVNKGESISVAHGNSQPLAGTSSQCEIRISDRFVSRTISAEDIGEDGYFYFDDKRKDLMSTAFFYLACLQEQKSGNTDSLGRFKYAGSIQQQKQTVLLNIVQHCFDEMWASLRMAPRSKKSNFFLSHDIDSVYGAIREDGFNVIKKGRFDLFLGMLFNLAMGRPEWLNIDKILKLESEYDCKSTFYWIVNKGAIDKVQINADYRISEKKIQTGLRDVGLAGSDHGLHKSLGQESFSAEVSKLGFLPLGNRYHYLKFQINDGLKSVEDAQIALDSSLGFSDHWGFRNNYGLPYNPFYVPERRPFKLVEAPLHIMDRTFFARGMSIADTEKAIFNFFESNKNDCVLSILWHNNFFTEYKFKGYLALYKKILAYIRDNRLQTLSQSDIIKTYSITWP